MERYCSNGQHYQFWGMVSDAVQYLTQSQTSAKLTDSTSMGQHFITKLESYLELSLAFKEFLLQVRDIFITQHINFSHLSSSKKVSMGSNTTSGTKKSSIAGHSTESGEALGSHLSGVALHNISKIMEGMDNFTLRVTRMLEIISTLGQFMRIILEQRIRGLPRFAGLWRVDGFYEEKEQEEDSLGQSFNQSDGVSLRTGTVPGDGSVSDITLATPDYLEMLVSKNIMQQQQQQPVEGGNGSVAEAGRTTLHSEALSALKEESWVASEQSADDTTPQKLQGLPKVTPTNNVTIS
jgi:hypothetical protein